MTKKKINFYCKEKGCNNKICKRTYYYGSGRCRKCSTNHMWEIHPERKIKKYYCSDCGKEICYENGLYGSGKCHSCVAKLRTGKKSSNWKGGIKTKKHYCIELDCNNEISYPTFRKGNRRCDSCCKKGRRNHFYGKKHTKEAKIKIAKSRKGIYVGKLCPRFGKPPVPAKRIKYNGICMRSSYEVAYAKYLDDLGIKWLYESKTFDLGNTTYTPDFYISEENKYIEIKGWFRKKSKDKMIKFKELYPDVKIKVLMKKDLQVLRIL